MSNVGRELWRDGNGWILVVLCAGWFLAFGVRFIFPTLIPDLRVAYGMDNTTAGLLISVLWIAYGIGQFPGGVFGDYLGERRILFGSVLLAAGSLVAVAWSSTIGILFASTIAFGLATGFYSPTAFTIPADIYTNRGTTAVGLIMAAGHAGSSVLPLIAGVITTYYIWSSGLLFAVPLLLLVGIGLWIIIPKLTQTDANGSPDVDRSVSALAAALMNSAVVVTGIILTLIVFILQGFTSFYPTYLMEIKGFSSTLSVTIYGLFFALGAIFAVAGGAAADAFGEKQTLGILFVLLAASLAGLPLADSVLAIVILTVLISGMLASIPILVSHLSVAIAPPVRNSGFGLIRAVYFVLGSGGPIFVGVFVDFDLFDTAFLSLAGLAVVAMILAVRLPAARTFE